MLLGPAKAKLQTFENARAALSDFMYSEFSWLAARCAFLVSYSTGAVSIPQPEGCLDTARKVHWQQ